MGMMTKFSVVVVVTDKGAAVFDDKAAALAALPDAHEVKWARKRGALYSIHAGGKIVGYIYEATQYCNGLGDM